VPIERRRRDELEVSFAGQRGRKRPIEFSTPPFCQGIGIAEEGLRRGFGEAVMLGGTVSVIEDDGFAYPVKFAELDERSCGR